MEHQAEVVIMPGAILRPDICCKKCTAYINLKWKLTFRTKGKQCIKHKTAQIRRLNAVNTDE